MLNGFAEFFEVVSKWREKVMQMYPREKNTVAKLYNEWENEGYHSHRKVQKIKTSIHMHALIAAIDIAEWNNVREVCRTILKKEISMNYQIAMDDEEHYLSEAEIAEYLLVYDDMHPVNHLAENEEVEKRVEYLLNFLEKNTVEFSRDLFVLGLKIDPELEGFEIATGYAVYSVDDDELLAVLQKDFMGEHPVIKYYNFIRGRVIKISSSYLVEKLEVEGCESRTDRVANSPEKMNYFAFFAATAIVSDNAVQALLSNEYLQNPFAQKYVYRDGIVELKSLFGTSVSMSHDDLVSVKRLYETFSVNPDHFLYLAARHLASALKRQEEIDCLIDVVTALESILISGNQQELAYRFALRGAILLESDYHKRKEIRTLFNTAYTTRSKKVHGASRVNKIKFYDSVSRAEKEIDLLTLVNKMHCLARKIMQKLSAYEQLKDDDWSSLELGQSFSDIAILAS